MLGNRVFALPIVLPKGVTKFGDGKELNGEAMLLCSFKVRCVHIIAKEIQRSLTSSAYLRVSPLSNRFISRSAKIKQVLST